MPKHAFPVAAEGKSDVSPVDPEKTVIAKRIADYRQAATAYEDAYDRGEALALKVTLPSREVVSGFAGVLDDEGKLVGRTGILMRTHQAIDNFCDGLADPRIPGAIEQAESRRASLHAELIDREREIEAVREASGLAAAEADTMRLAKALNDSLLCVLIHLPGSLEEYRLRDAFMYELLDSGFELNEDEWRALFAT